jgi:hypothetical protein
MNARLPLMLMLSCLVAACAQTPASTIRTTPSATATPSEPAAASLAVAASAIPFANHFAGDGFSFDYPGHWREISGYLHAGRHGPTVLAAVGVGDFDLGCSAAETNSMTCSAGPRWTVPNDGVVLAYRFDAWLGSIAPQPTPVLGTGDRWVDVAGRRAVLSETGTSMLLHFAGAPEYIEAHWGAAVAEDARAEVEATVAAWVWSRTPSPAPRAVATETAESAPPSLAAGEFVLPTRAPNSNGGGDALLTGRLGGTIQDQGPCIWLEQWDLSARLTQRASIIWPFGFRGFVDPLRVAGPAGQLIAEVGDAIELGGGGPPQGYVPTQAQDPCGLGQVLSVSSVVSVEGR